MIITDPAGNDSHAPTVWLREDLSQARARGNKRFFVFGHKMAFTYHVKPRGKEKGLDTFPESGEAFWKVIQDFDATYFCGHEHIYHAMQPRNSGNHHPWQIIVGAAGAPFEAKPGDSANPNDRKFGWTLIKISASGHVRMDTYLFDERFGPTTVVETIDLTPPGV